MIELIGLQKVINQTLVVDVENLTVSSGEVVALVGPPESGRDTILALLTGKMRPTVGNVRVDGLDPVANREQFSHKVGVMFATDSLYEHRSALANLTFNCHLRGLPKSRAREVLTDVGLADQANTPAGKLSAGLRRRLAYGRAILHTPEVLLLAAPFAGCDAATIALLTRLIQHQAQTGNTVLILTDTPAHLVPLCDTIHTLKQGRIVETYTPEPEPDPQLPFKIPVRLEGRVALVTPADILYALAQEGRVYLQTVTEQLPTQFTLTELEERLARSGFFRAHRGYLVNLQHVKEVIPYTRSSYSLILDDNAETEVPLSKSAAAELRELLGY